MPAPLRSLMASRPLRVFSLLCLATSLLLSVGLVQNMTTQLNRDENAPSAGEKPDINHYPGYALLWHDEFDYEGRPDPDIWNYGETGFIRNREDQWYQPDNAWVADGKLVIEARRIEPVPSPHYDPDGEDWRTQRRTIRYTSTLIQTRGKREWRYGRLEVRGRIDIGEGVWPAIWTLGSAREWPGCGEIDLMEYYDHSLLANAAWAGPERFVPRWDSSKIPLVELGDPQAWSGEFHVWRMDWDEHYIRLYVDGRMLNEIDLSQTVNETPDGANPFHEPHYLLLNVAVGGTNGGDPSGTEFPRRFEVDWVRVYEKTREEQAASPEPST